MFHTFLKITGLACMIIVLPVQGVHASESVKLEWIDLVPKTAPLKSPLDVLTDDQAREFGNIQYWRSIDDGTTDKDTLEAFKDIIKATRVSRRKLEKQGIDVDFLFDRYEKWQDELDRRSKLTVKKLHGKRVSLAGYLLPLDFSDKGVKEFLLVPYVGACIHVPPPPANQIAFVRLKKAYKINALYEPGDGAHEHQGGQQEPVTSGWCERY